VFEIYIKTTPERLWEAITDPDQREVYSFGLRTTSDWTPGSSYESFHPSMEGPFVTGENVEVDPPRRLVQTMTALWGEDVVAEGTSRVTWEIRKVADNRPMLSVFRRAGFEISSQFKEGVVDVAFDIVPTEQFRETGEHLDTPGSLRYSQAAG
jgi:uncharacterized protein YndB with AHSA1/START domain